MNNKPTKYANFLKFVDKLKKIIIKEQLTPNSPWVCFSNEIGISDLSAAGGLGYLAGDWVILAGKLGIPFVGICLYYRTKWHQEIGSDFWQIEKYYHTTHPGKYQFKKLRNNNEKKIYFKFRSNNLYTNIEVYVKYFSGNPMIILYEPGFRGLYEGIKEEEHRLYQSAVLGFVGVWVLEFLSINPSIFHLNESSTAISALAYLDFLCRKGYQLSQALKILGEKIIYTNHTISSAAEPVWNKNQLEKYVFPNIKNSNVKDWLNKVIIKENNNVRLSNIAIKLTQKVNAVSNLHAKKISKIYGINFHSITNAISNRWIYPEIWQTYLKYNIFDNEHRLPERNYKKRLEKFELINMLEIKERAKKDLLSYLASERKDQYNKKIVLCQKNIKLAVWARRFDQYKRPNLLFMNEKKLSFILEKNNIHFLLAGKAHQMDIEMKKILQNILTTIDSNEILKKRVHFIQDYDWKLAKKFAGADILLNTPRIGWEACGTSWEKGVMNWLLLCTTPDGGPADICSNYNSNKEKPCFLIKGNKDGIAAESLYVNLELMANLLINRIKWHEAVIRQLKAFLPIANGARMMKDYLEFRFRET